MKEFDRISDYVEAGPKRLNDAWELLEPPTRNSDVPDAGHRHLRGAVYLAGYAVECALKAYIISRAPSAERFDEAIEARRRDGGTELDFRGKRAHNLGRLLGATDLEAAMDADVEVKKAWGLLYPRWRPDLRYDPTHWTSRHAATTLIHAADKLHEWIREQRTSD